MGVLILLSMINHPHWGIQWTAVDRDKRDPQQSPGVRSSASRKEDLASWRLFRLEGLNEHSTIGSLVQDSERPVAVYRFKVGFGLGDKSIATN